MAVPVVGCVRRGRIEPERGRGHRDMTIVDR